MERAASSRRCARPPHWNWRAIFQKAGLLDHAEDVLMRWCRLPKDNPCAARLWYWLKDIGTCRRANGIAPSRRPDDHAEFAA